MAVGKPALVHIPPPTGMECEALISEVKTEKKTTLSYLSIFSFITVLLSKKKQELYILCKNC